MRKAATFLLLALCFGTLVSADRLLLKNGADDPNPGTSTTLPGTSPDDKGGLNNGGGNGGGGSAKRLRVRTAKAYTTGADCAAFDAAAKAGYAAVAAALSPSATIVVACSPSDDLLKGNLKITLSISGNLTRKGIRRARNKVNNAIENGSFNAALPGAGVSGFPAVHG